MAISGLKRLGIAIAAVVAIGIALAVAPWFIPADSVRQAIRAEIKAMTGLEPVLRGDASASLFPWGVVSFADVVLGEDQRGEPALAAQRVTARLRLVPLLFGRIEAADLSLVSPRILVSFGPGGSSNWAGLAETLARTLGPGAKPADAGPSFSEMRITDGTIVVRDAGGVEETLSRVDLSLAWPSISQSFAATGRFVWRDEALDASVSVNDLLAALVGERAGLKLRLAGAPFKLAFDGHVSRRPTFKLEGTLAADTHSLRQALVWAGQKALPGGGFGRFAIKAHTNVLGGTIALSGVNVELDGNTAEGVLALASDGRTMLQGTLAADDIDLTPYVSTFRFLRAAERDWSAVPIALDGLTGFDVDLRLSAARIALANARLGRTAVAANLRDGRLTVTIGESQAFGGVLKGSFVIGKSPAGAEVKSQLQFADVDLENCLGELVGFRRLEGKGTLAFSMEASGDSILALTQTLSGSAVLTAGRGTLTGFNVEQYLRQLERRPLSSPTGLFRNGRTPFETLAAKLKFSQGMAVLEDVHLDGGSVRLALAGSASIPTRDLDLKGTASLAGEAERAPGFELPFAVQGAWDEPIVSLDTEILIQRSSAARRMLEGDRKSRDSAHSIIESLSQGPPPPASPVAAERGNASSAPAQ